SATAAGLALSRAAAACRPTANARWLGRTPVAIGPGLPPTATWVPTARVVVSGQSREFWLGPDRWQRCPRRLEASAVARWYLPSGEGLVGVGLKPVEYPLAEIEDAPALASVPELPFTSGAGQGRGRDG